MRTSLLSFSAVGAAVLAIAFLPPPAEAQTNSNAVELITLKLNGKPQKIDENLNSMLDQALGQHMPPGGDFDTYEKQIDEVVNRHREKGAAYIAHMTPYAYVVAKLRGAEFDVLATYYNTRKTYTYHSYFVVRRSYRDFNFSATPTLQEAADFLTKSTRRFIYHDQFSTSSYFAPSLFFRRQHLFSVPEEKRNDDPNEKICPIRIEQFGSSSSKLIKEVAEERADIAAVWDEPKDHVDAELAKKVLFIQLPDILPNDFLVAARWLDPGRRQQIQRAIETMPCDAGRAIDDYVCWKPISTAFEAQTALEELTRKAVAAPAPVTIQIVTPSIDQHNTELKSKYDNVVRAAKEAIRFAGTEFADHDDYSGTPADVEWKLELVHDGALRLTSAIKNESSVPDTRLAISFTDTVGDLQKHIQTFIITRMPRFRYVWPYEKGTPTVLRDVAFTPLSSTVVQPITWQNADRHAFTLNKSFPAVIASSDTNKFELKPEKPLDLNPMSNSAYRVILAPPAEKGAMFNYVTVLLVALFVAAAGLAVFEFVRLLRTAEERPAVSVPAVAATPMIPIKQSVGVDSATPTPTRRRTTSKPGTGSRRPPQPPQ